MLNAKEQTPFEKYFIVHGCGQHTDTISLDALQFILKFVTHNSLKRRHTHPTAKINIQPVWKDRVLSTFDQG